MKHLSAIEVQYITAELQYLVGARLDQVYQQAKKELIFQFHVRSKGRALLKVRVPYAAYLATNKATPPVNPGFCALLRKKLKNSTLKAVTQPGFERIIQLQFSSKNGHLDLIFELFSKGNVILTQNRKIIAAAEKQSWSSRTVAVNESYTLPPPVTDPRSLEDKQLQSLLKSTNKTDLVRFLALELSLGGLYAEEVCLLSGIDKKKIPAAITITEVSKLLNALKKLLISKPSPSIILENNHPIDAVPVNMNYYKNHDKKEFKSYSEALEAFFLTTETKDSRYDKEISRLQTIIDHQQSTILEAKNLAQKSSKTGELIYEHYQEVKLLLETVNNLRKSKGWLAVKQLKKSNKKLKSIDDKTGKIVVDL